MPRLIAQHAISLLLALLLAACTAAPTAPAELTIAPSAYSPAFEAAKSAILELGFELDRVDARAGIITSRPKGTGGLATPWDAEQTTFHQELEDLANHQQRTIRISFWPDGHDLLESPDLDLRDNPDPLRARVEVAILRTHRPGWRIDTTSVQQSRRWRDPDMGRRGLAGIYTVPFTLDTHLAHRLARDIDRRAAGATFVPLDTQPPRPITPPHRDRPTRAPTPTSYWD